MMMRYRWTVLLTFAALTISAGATSATVDRGLRLHPPLVVATPRDGGLITP
jgi:hypothetical protein